MKNKLETLDTQRPYSVRLGEYEVWDLLKTLSSDSGASEFPIAIKPDQQMQLQFLRTSLPPQTFKKHEGEILSYFAEISGILPENGNENEKANTLFNNLRTETTIPNQNRADTAYGVVVSLISLAEARFETAWPDSDKYLLESGSR